MRGSMIEVTNVTGTRLLNLPESSTNADRIMVKSSSSRALTGRIAVTGPWVAE